MKRRAKPRSICDVPGCGRERKRTHRLCDRCFDRLPGEFRVGINEAHHQRRWQDWRALRIRADDFLNLTRREATEVRTARLDRPTVSPQRAYELQARMLGERTDA